MDPNTPIACSLDGAELQDRYQDHGRFGSAHLIGRSSDASGHLLRFQQTPGTQQQLRSLVAAEEECCPFLSFTLTEGADEVELHIAAEEDGRPIADELAAAFDRVAPATIPGDPTTAS